MAARGFVGGARAGIVSRFGLRTAAPESWCWTVSMWERVPQRTINAEGCANSSSVRIEMKKSASTRTGRRGVPAQACGRRPLRLMHAGNPGPSPLDTLLRGGHPAPRQTPALVFCWLRGGGGLEPKVRRARCRAEAVWKRSWCLPHQPAEKVPAALSAQFVCGRDGQSGLGTIHVQNSTLRSALQSATSARSTVMLADISGWCGKLLLTSQHVALSHQNSGREFHHSVKTAPPAASNSAGRRPSCSTRYSDGFAIGE